jgi:hypothetical protein
MFFCRKTKRQIRPFFIGWMTRTEVIENSADASCAPSSGRSNGKYAEQSAGQIRLLEEDFSFRSNFHVWNHRIYRIQACSGRFD